MLKKIGMANTIMITIFLLLSLLLLSNGLLSVVSWLAIKLVLPVIGIVLFVVTLVRSVRKKISQTQRICSFAICVIYIFPVLITINAIPIAYPANIDFVKPAVTVQWPLREETMVAWGGDSIETNLPHAMWGSEKWAYDMVMEPHDTNTSNLADYGIWNKEIVSPVYGTVVAAYDGDTDIMPNQDEFESLEGNYVYIRIEESGTYLLLNHLKQGSVVFSVGDKLEPGDLLGRVGNSGTSSEPHLHIHHQRQDPTKVLHPLFAEGLPLFFENSQGISMPEGGTLITP